MSIVFPNRTFAQTFSCGTLMHCNEFCPVKYDNFADDSSAPFFLEKYREFIEMLNTCKYQPDQYAYYTPVSVPINQYETVVRPYYMNTEGFPKKIAERYYRVQY